MRARTVSARGRRTRLRRKVDALLQSWKEICAQFVHRYGCASKISRPGPSSGAARARIVVPKSLLSRFFQFAPKPKPNLNPNPKPKQRKLEPRKRGCRRPHLAANLHHFSLIFRAQLATTSLCRAYHNSLRNLEKARTQHGPQTASRAQRTFGPRVSVLVIRIITYWN